MTADLTQFLQILVRCPSVTPDEGGALDLLQNFLERPGFTCTRLPFEEDGTEPVDNLFARIGTGSPHFCFAGHSDVVPAGDPALWRHGPFAGVIDGGKLYGRGACDMKGSVAAFAFAAVEYIKACNGKLPGSISLLITGDEEGPAVNGTVKMLNWLAETGQIPDDCVVGEPTSSDYFGDTIKNGRRGSAHFTITATGTQGHVAYPHKADNPVVKLARLLDRLSQLTLDDGTASFDPSTLAVSSFDVGNRARNVIPGRATAQLNIRFNDAQSFDSLCAIIKEQCAGVESELGGNFQIEMIKGADVFLTPPGPLVDVVRDAVKKETGKMVELSTSGGTSDARFIKNFCPVVEFGPINATIHQVDEHISIAGLAKLKRVYFNILKGYFSRSPEL